MIKSFYRTKEWAMWAYGGGLALIVSLWFQVQMSVAINTWYGKFYDLLQNAKDYVDKPQEGITSLYEQLVSLQYILTGFEGNPSFAVIAFPYIALAIFTGWFTRIYGLRWREAITFNYIPQWQAVDQEIEGASQRIQEDCNRWARIIESLGLQVVRAVMTLIAFIPILYGFSDKVDIPIIRDFEGSLVWGTLIISLGGLVISWFVGWKLPGLEYNNQRVEAAFRKDLVLGEDDKANYAQSDTLAELFLGIKFNYHRLYLHYGYFDCWVTFYDQFMIIAPYLIMGPSLFTGAITLGVMVQVSNALSRVHGGFALFLHNWTTITELRSIWKRLHEFEDNLIKYAKKNKIPIPKDKKGAPPFSVDDNLYHTSTEGKVLENPKKTAPEFIFQRTISPEKSPNKASYVTIGFKNGDPITVNGKKLSPGNLLQKLNILAGKNGIGRVDLVENRFLGIKSRGIYETPGGTLLMTAHRAIESVTLDKETMHKKDEIMPKYAELIYNGYWYSKARFKLQKIVDLKRNKVNGSVKLKLYKGNITIVSRQTKSKAYSMKKVSFEENKTFNKSNVERFINFHKKRLR